MSVLSDPEISIVVPSYNQGRFLSDNLSEACSYPGQVEVLVFDGGSSDNTLEVLDSFNKKLAYWVSAPDRGQVDAINKGLKMARGKWVAFQNSDDFYLPGALAQVLNSLIAAEYFDVLIAGTMFVDEHGCELRRTMPKPILFPCMSQLNFIHNQAFFVRRKIVEECGVLNEDLRFCLDYEWFVRILRSKPKIKYLNVLVGAQRLHEDTKTSNLQDTHDSEFTEITKTHFTSTERVLGFFLLLPYQVFRFLYGRTLSSKYQPPSGY